MPDESSVLKFRHVLEQHNRDEMLFAHVGFHAVAQEGKLWHWDEGHRGGGQSKVIPRPWPRRPMSIDSQVLGELLQGDETRL